MYEEKQKVQHEIAYADKMAREERDKRLHWERFETSKLDYEKKYLAAETEKRRHQNEEDFKSAKIKTMQVHKCKAPKTRNYQCDDDGYKVVKFFTYQYDFESDSCIEHVKKETKPCGEQTLSSRARRDSDGRFTEHFDDFEEVILPRNKKANQKVLKEIEPAQEREEEDLYILKNDDVGQVQDQNSVSLLQISQIQEDPQAKAIKKASSVLESVQELKQKLKI